MKHYLVLFFMISFGSFGKELGPEQFINDLFEGSTDLFETHVYQNPNYKIEQLVDSLLLGNKEEVSLKLLDELADNAPTNLNLMDAIFAKMEKDPNAKEKFIKSVSEIKTKFPYKELVKLTPTRCMMLTGLYFGISNASFSQQAYQSGQSSARRESFTSLAGQLNSLTKYGALGICLLEIYETRTKYRDISSNLRSYFKKQKNLTYIRKFLESIDFSRVDERNLVKLKSAIEGKTLNEFLKNENIKKTNPILKEYETFLQSNDFKDLQSKYLQSSPTNIEEYQKKIEQRFLNFYSQKLNKPLDRIKLDLINAQEEYLKNFYTKGTVPLHTKLCFGILGLGVFTAGHLATIGVSKTPFDNLDDKWFRKHGEALLYASGAATITGCLSSIPRWLFERRKSNTQQLEKKYFHLNSMDIENLNNILEKGKKSLKTSVLSLIGEKFNELRIDPTVTTIDEIKSKEIHNIVDRFTKGERALYQNTLRQIKNGETELLSEIVDSTSYQKHEILIDAITNNNLTQAQLILEEMKGNQTDILRYLLALQKKVSLDPKLAQGIKANLNLINDQLRLKNIPPPTPVACMAAVNAYFGLRDFFLSFHGSYLKPNFGTGTDSGYGILIDSIDNLTILGMTYYCIQNFITIKKDLPKYLRRTLSKRNAQEFITELKEITDVLHHDKKLQMRLSKVKNQRLSDTTTKLKFIDNINRRMSIELESTPKNLSSAWKNFKLSIAFNKTIKSVSAELDTREQKVLQNFLKYGELEGAAYDEYLKIIEHQQEKMTKAFKLWVQSAHPHEARDLINQIALLKKKQHDLYDDDRKLRLGNKACLWSMGAAIAAAGYSAAVGHEETPIDSSIEKFERDNYLLTYGVPSLLALGTCSFDFFYLRFKRIGVKRRAAYKNEPLLQIKKSEWNYIEKVAVESLQEAGEFRGSGAEVRAKDFARSLSENLSAAINYNKKVLEKRIKIEEKFKNDIINALPNENLNFNNKCLNTKILSFIP